MMIHRVLFSISSKSLAWLSDSDLSALPSISTIGSVFSQAVGRLLLASGIRVTDFTWDGREGFISVFRPFHVVRDDAARSPHIKTDRLGLGAAVDPLQYVESFFQQNRAT
jgi:hypothetical protein